MVALMQAMTSDQWLTSAWQRFGPSFIVQRPNSLFYSKYYLIMLGRRLDAVHGTSTAAEFVLTGAIQFELIMNQQFVLIMSLSLKFTS